MKEKELPAEHERIVALEQSLRARTFELEVLHDLSRKIGAALNYDELFHTVLVHLEQAVACDVAAGLLCLDGCHLYMRRQGPLEPAAQVEVENRLLNALGRLGHTISRDQLVLTPVEEEAGSADAERIERLGSFCQAPIIIDRATVGLIFAGAGTERRFTEEHIRLLCTVANQTASAVQRMRAFLETERRRLRTVVDHLPEGVILLDRWRRVTMANPASRLFLDLLPEVSLGKRLARVGAIPFDELAERSPRDVVVEGAGKRIVEATVVHLEQDSNECWLLVLRDVTDVREAIHRRDRFLAMLSHELRNPLAGITGAVQILRAPNVEQRISEQAKSILFRQTSHVTRLVDDLLDVSRFLHGKIHVVKQPLDLGDLTARVGQAHRLLCEGEGKTLHVSCPDEPLTVAGDSARLTQVLDNLLSNARKFTPPGGTIELSCTRQDNRAVLLVRDTGIGIDPDKFSEIFEPFTQGDESIDRAQGGLGLGLTLVKTLVAMHDGTVSVQSGGLGKGSELRVELPLSTAAPPVRQEVAQPTGKLRVLIVEDDSDARDMLAELLQLEGHDVVAVGTGPEGLEAFRRRPPDLALIDIGLPGMDGYQVVRALRAAGDSRSRLVALTGYAQPEDRRRALEAGFDTHLAKPIQIHELQELLAGDGAGEGVTHQRP
jgi:signal transduction histidine kinase/CheY-like chemotaxis protein